MRRLLIFVMSMALCLALSAADGASIPGVYRIPCGSLAGNTCLTRIDVCGEGVLTELHYSPVNNSRWVLYTKERARVMSGGVVDVTGVLQGWQTAGLAVSVCADFDGDGSFEQTVLPDVAADIAVRLLVPDDAGEGCGRIRIRIDQNGSTVADDDVSGVVYDLPVYVDAPRETRRMSVAVNSDGRGEATIDGYDTGTAEVERGTELTVRAKCAKGYVFKGWRQGVTIVSTQMVYSTTMTEDKNLVAMFAPKSGDSLYGEEYLMLTFDRSVSPVRVTVSDEDGNVVEGVEARLLTSAYQKDSWSGAAVADKTDISPSTGAVGEVRRIPFALTGISTDYHIGRIHCQIAAVNYQGAYQGAGTNRMFRFSVLMGADEDNLTEFAALEGNINKNPGQRTVWTFAQEGVVIEPGSDFCVEVQLKNIDTNPCYSALYAVVLQRAETDDDTSVEGMPELSYSPADGVYIVGESVVVFKGGLRYNLCGQRLWK